MSTFFILQLNYDLPTAAKINPKSGLAFRIKRGIFLAMNHPEKPYHEFNTAIKLNPTDAVSLSGYAKSMELQEKNLSTALEPDNKLFKKRLKTILGKIEENTLQSNDAIKAA